MHRAAMIRGKNFSKKKREKISMARQKIKRYRDILKDFIDADGIVPFWLVRRDKYGL